MKIGIVGLGIMGESMSENIVKKHDDEVYVFDFVKEKVELLESKGEIGCSSSLKLAEKIRRNNINGSKVKAFDGYL